MDTKDVPNVPLLRALPALYRALLTITRRHGMFTIARNHVRLYPRGQRVQVASGATVYLPPDPHFIGFMLGRHENHVAELMIRHVRPGDICVDVGANIGYFSAILSRLAGPGGRVLSFEPVPENFEVLSVNATLAAQTGAAVTATRAAVSAETGELRIVRQAHSTGHQVSTSESASEERVPAIALDVELLKAIGDSPVAFLKVDVEGHELSVLKGARQLVQDGRVRRMVVEITPGPDAALMTEILGLRPHQLWCWHEEKWKALPISELRERTDVFIEFAP